MAITTVWETSLVLKNNSKKGQSMRFVIAAITVLATAAASAAEPIGPYFGVSVGSAKITRELTDDYTASTNKVAWIGQAGWQFTGDFGLEAQYIGVKKITATDTDGTDTATVSAKFSGVTLSGIYTLAIAENLSAHARLGAIRARERYSGTLNGDPIGTFSDSTTELLYGIGLGTTLEGAKIRLEYERAEFNYGKVSLISLGLNWYIPQK